MCISVFCDLWCFITGYLTGSENYYTHYRTGGLDLHSEVNSSLKNEWGYNGQYSAHVFARKAEELIENHDKNKVQYTYTFASVLLVTDSI